MCIYIYTYYVYYVYIYIYIHTHTRKMRCGEARVTPNYLLSKTLI